MEHPILGAILPWAIPNFPPAGWDWCVGQILAISDNTSLYALYGTTYGGDGRSTFAVPDLRSRSVVGVDKIALSGTTPALAPYLTRYEPGNFGGLETITLQVSEIPGHIHPAVGETRTSNTYGVNTVNTKVNKADLLISMGDGVRNTPNPGDYLGSNIKAGAFSANVYANPAASPAVTIPVSGVDVSIDVLVTTDVPLPKIPVDISVEKNTGGGAHENRSPFLALNWIISYDGAFPNRN